MTQGRDYVEFYESLSRHYPETSLVHSYGGVTSRYMAVMRELRRKIPFLSMLGETTIARNRDFQMK